MFACWHARAGWTLHTLSACSCGRVFVLSISTKANKYRYIYKTWSRPPMAEFFGAVYCEQQRRGFPFVLYVVDTPTPTPPHLDARSVDRIPRNTVRCLCDCVCWFEWQTRARLCCVYVCCWSVLVAQNIYETVYGCEIRVCLVVGMFTIVK